MLSQKELSIPKLLNQTTAILLDYNGTLSDDEDVLFEIIASISYQEFGIHLDSARYFSEFVGQTEEYIFDALARECSGTGLDSAYTQRLLKSFNSSYLTLVRQRSTISVEVREFVKVAKSRRKKLALVTAASRDIVEAPLADAGLYDLFDAIVCLEDVNHSKPEPDVYIRALNLLNVEAQHGIAFEDSKTGIRAAHAANLRSVAVLGSLSQDEAFELTPLAIRELSPNLFI